MDTEIKPEIIAMVANAQQGGPIIPGAVHYNSLLNLLIGLYGFTAELHGLEIGVDVGQMEYTILQAMPNVKMFGIDMKEDPIPAEHIIHGRYTHIKGKSCDVMGQFMDKIFDFIYVDGDHSYDGCLSDIKLYRRCLKDKGVLAGHDYCEQWPGVIQAIKEEIGDINLLPDLMWYKLYGF